MQPTDSQPIRVIFSASDQELIDPAEQFMRGFTERKLEIQRLPYEQLFLAQERAEETGANLIVLALRADDEGRIDPRSEFGSVSLDSDIPVLVLRVCEGEKPAFVPVNRIVVPLDGSSTAAQAIPLAARFATLANLPVKFVMVIDPSRVIPAAYAYDPEAWGVISDLRQTAHWALRQAEDQLRGEGIAVESDLLFGPVNACLRENVGTQDLLVMTTHGSGRAAMRRVGSVAERVLAATPQPIVIMRASLPADVIVEGYEACSWVEPLTIRART
jgi:nucleotide-binding universal stress UspA family protein